ncbi:MAG: menaquinone biosynthesis protein [Phycisphaerae bacterium]|jgi:chorismate dehydratase
MGSLHDEGGEPAALGVVSFLNALPLVEGLDATTGVSLVYAVPSALAGMLRGGEVDAALIPVIDLARGQGRWRRISDAGIAADGETLTVRVFSRVPPEEMTVLYADDDSHTSVALARLIWSRYYERQLHVRPLSAADGLEACDSVLLIGDKVVSAPMHDFGFDVDLGGAWKEWTGLPFVFAAWAAPPGGRTERLAALLSAARDRGVARALDIAAQAGPPRGWPVELAEEYLTRRLMYTLTPPAVEGMKLFFDLAAEEGIIAERSELVEPAAGA